MTGCIVKFVQVCEEQISIGTCSNSEKAILHKWLRSEYLCEVIKKCRDKDIIDEAIKELLVSKFDIIYELLTGCITYVEFILLLKAEKEAVPIVNSMSRQQVAFLEECRKIKGCGSLEEDFYTKFKPKN